RRTKLEYSKHKKGKGYTRVKPSKCFSLQPNSETTKVLDVSALIIDKEYMSQEKLSSWLERHEILVENISQWGLHGAIVQCRDVLQSPLSDTNRINISNIAEAWGKVLFIGQNPSGSEICFLETCDLRSILELGTISISCRIVSNTHRMDYNEDSRERKRWKCSLIFKLELVPSCLINCDLEPLSLDLELLEIIYLASSLDHLCNTLPSCDLVSLDQHAHTLCHLESCLTISFDNL
ncbi:hypothetical protein Tco_1107715, partial [Tanacetum coccineum]